MTVEDRQTRGVSLRRPRGTPRVTRRGLQIVLGALWLLDGVLQFQPFMFTQDFFTNTLGMANMGLPAPVATVEYDLTSALAARPVLSNALFATLQIVLGVGLLRRRTSRLALAGSVLWALGVWGIGEGFGGLFMSGTDLLTGAPGAALLYALVALALWPCPERAGPSIADGSVLGGGAARWTWLILWVGVAALELEPAARVPAAQLSNAGEGEPAMVAAVNHTAGGLVSGGAAVFVVVLGLIEAAIGVAVLVPRTRRLALGAGMALAGAAGLLGQDLGGLLTGHATDPGTGPALVLFALTLWPRPVQPAAHRLAHIPAIPQPLRSLS